MKQELSISTSRGFPAWLDANKVSIVFTTYQGGRVFFLGLGKDGRPSAFGSSYSRCMGLAPSADGRTLFMATDVQIYRFDDVVPPGKQTGDHDAIYGPHQTWITGDLDIHEIGIGEDGQPVFASTMFNCLGTVSSGYSFRPLWRPSFISRFVPEDRCHLNGVAFADGRPRYVTCVSRTDIVDGWRDHRAEGGVVVDVASGEVVGAGLSMPHSPRLRDGRLWLLNSGTGEFGWIDLATERFNAVTFCPGYARGLSFVGNYAVIGLSRARKNRTFQGLKLDAALEKHGVTARCGLFIVALETGNVTEWMRIEGVIDELFDVAVLPNVRYPSVLGLKQHDIRRTISIDPERHQ